MNGAFVGAHLVNLVQSGDLKKGSLVKVIGCSVNVIQDEIQLFITALEVVDKSSTVSASGEDRMEGVEKQGARSPEPSSPSQKRWVIRNHAIYVHDTHSFVLIVIWLKQLICTISVSDISIQHTLLLSPESYISQQLSKLHKICTWGSPSTF